MLKSLLKSAAALSLLVAGSAAATPLTNLSFEDGLAGHTTSGSAAVVTTATAYDGTVYSATAGNSFLQLTSAGMPTGAYGGTNGAWIDFNVNLAAGSKFSFDWAFLGMDYAPFLDFALFIGDTQVMLSSIAQTGNYGDTGWQSYTWTLSQAFSGTVRILVSNFQDTGLNSRLLLDNFRVQVPEPASVALLGLGLLALGARRRKA